MNEDIPPQVKRAAAARYRADVARHDLTASVGELKARLTPQALAKRTADTVTDRAAKGVLSARKAAQSHPAATGALAGLTGLFLMWRVGNKVRKGDSHDG
ncbi:hypothetical protein B5C34_14180 [Pacificimonas flava]|uniref:DUF3618 domain-containing protein n=2 Tax=Pacificimonas TaxID=1960290 RepID=A0A219B8A2_9SPHN|nr:MULTISPECIES: hypothetical protein [Pacificimonas]MBZ6379972.1 hypothetical protein [Pacificimonas aurantium]OWV34491.1 hypothetical protein B5C34_14180 [Pacificimonas flava]